MGYPIPVISGRHVLRKPLPWCRDCRCKYKPGGSHAIRGVTSLGKICVTKAVHSNQIDRHGFSESHFHCSRQDPQTATYFALRFALPLGSSTERKSICCSASLLGHGWSCSSLSLPPSSTRARPNSIPVGQLRRSTWERRSARCKHFTLIQFIFWAQSRWFRIGIHIALMGLLFWSLWSYGYREFIDRYQLMSAFLGVLGDKLADFVIFGFDLACVLGKCLVSDWSVCLLIFACWNNFISNYSFLVNII